MEIKNTNDVKRIAIELRRTQALTYAKIRKAINQEFGIHISNATMTHWFKSANLTSLSDIELYQQANKYAIELQKSNPLTCEGIQKAIKEEFGIIINTLTLKRWFTKANLAAPDEERDTRIKEYAIQLRSTQQLSYEKIRQAIKEKFWITKDNTTLKKWFEEANITILPKKRNYKPIIEYAIHLRTTQGLTYEKIRQAIKQKFWITIDNATLKKWFDAANLNSASVERQYESAKVYSEDLRSMQAIK